MKVSLDVAQLRNCLHPIVKVTKKLAKGVDASYNQALFEFSNNVLTLFGTDGSYAVRAEYGKLESVENCVYLVEAAAFYSMLTRPHSTTIELNFTEKELLVDDNGNKYHFSYYGGVHTHQALFTVQSTQEDKLIFEITPTEFGKVVQFLLPDMAKDVARSYLTGIYYDGNFVSTDSTACGVVPFNNSKNTIFLLRDGLDLVSSLPAADVPCKIYESVNVVKVISESIMLLMPQVSKTFPDYTVITKAGSGYPFQYVFNKGDLYNIIQKLIPFADMHHRFVSQFIFNPNGTLQITVESVGSKKGNETLAATECAPVAQSMKLLVSLEYISGILGTIEEDTVCIRFSESNRAPMSISEDSGRIHYLSLILTRE